MRLVGGDVALLLGYLAAFFLSGVPSAVVGFACLGFHLQSRLRVALLPINLILLLRLVWVILSLVFIGSSGGRFGPLYIVAVFLPLLATLAVELFVFPVHSRLLPPPSGPFQTGRVILRLPPQQNNLHVQIFYPVAASDRTPYAASYVSHEQIPAGLAKFMEMHPIIFAWIRLIRGWVRPLAPVVPSVPSSCVGASKVKELLRPIVFSHGLGAVPDVYGSQICELVSQGFVVLAPEHRDGSATMRKGATDADAVELIEPLTAAQKANRMLEYERRHGELKHRVAEAVDVLNLIETLNAPTQQTDSDDANWLFARKMFQSRFDTTCTVAFGHSFGAATALSTAVHDARIRCVVAHDPWGFPLGADTLVKGLADTPALVILGRTFTQFPSLVSAYKLLLDRDTRRDAIKLAQARGVSGDANKELVVALNGIQDDGTISAALLSRLSSVADRIDTLAHPQTRLMGLKDIEHQSFTDFVLLSPPILRRMGMIGKSSSTSQVQLLRHITLAFLAETSPSRDVRERAFSPVSEAELLSF